MSPRRLWLPEAGEVSLSRPPQALRSAPALGRGRQAVPACCGRAARGVGANPGLASHTAWPVPAAGRPEPQFPPLQSGVTAQAPPSRGLCQLQRALIAERGPWTPWAGLTLTFLRRKGPPRREAARSGRGGRAGRPPLRVAEALLP